MKPIDYDNLPPAVRAEMETLTAQRDELLAFAKSAREAAIAITGMRDTKPHAVVRKLFLEAEAAIEKATGVTVVLAVGDRCWGRGRNEEEAYANMRAAGGHRGRKIVAADLYLCHKDTVVRGDGGLAYPRSHPPQLISNIRAPKPRKKK